MWYQVTSTAQSLKTIMWDADYNSSVENRDTLCQVSILNDWSENIYINTMDNAIDIDKSYCIYPGNEKVISTNYPNQLMLRTSINNWNIRPLIS
jgi:hypothetical protein